MSSQENDYSSQVHQSIDFVTDMLRSEIEIVAMTIFSCIQLGHKVIMCSTYGNILVSDFFAQELNRLFVHSNGSISVCSLNSDARNLALLKSVNGNVTFSAQFDLVAKENDLLILIPGTTLNDEDPTAQAIINLMEKAKQLNLLTICINNSLSSNFILEKLGTQDICLNFNAIENQDAALLTLFYVIQTILRIIKQQLN